MSLYILDTDHLTLFQKAHPAVVRQVERVGTEEIAITIISVEEQLRGWLSVVRRHAAQPRVIWAYTQFREAVEFFSNIDVLDFDQPAREQFLDLKAQKIRVGTQDLRIASIALATNRILLTRNRRDFERIPDITFEDWTAL